MAGRPKSRKSRLVVSVEPQAWAQRLGDVGCGRLALDHKMVADCGKENGRAIRNGMRPDRHAQRLGLFPLWYESTVPTLRFRFTCDVGNSPNPKIS